MTKIVTRMMAATAALGLVAAPIMAHANTRATNSTAAYKVGNALPGLGRAASGERQNADGSILLGVIATVTIVGGFYFFTETQEDDCASPGTC